MTGGHRVIPNGWFLICHLCYGHLEKEENEITRHYRSEHADRPDVLAGPRNSVYRRCRLIREEVAADLLGNVYVNRMKATKTHYEQNFNPKTPFATVQDMVSMYTFHQRYANHAWLQSLPGRPMAPAAANNAPPPNPAVVAAANIQHPPSPPPAPAPAPAVNTVDNPFLTTALVFQNHSTMPKPAPRVWDPASDIVAEQVRAQLAEEEALAKEAASPLTVHWDGPGRYSVFSDVPGIPDIDDDDFVYKCNICPRYDEPFVFLSEFWMHYFAVHHDALLDLFAANYAGRYIMSVVHREEYIGAAPAPAPNNIARDIGQLQMSTHPDDADLWVLAPRCYICGYKAEKLDAEDLYIHFLSQHWVQQNEIAAEVFGQWRLEVNKKT